MLNLQIAKIVLVTGLLAASQVVSAQCSMFNGVGEKGLTSALNSKEVPQEGLDVGPAVMTLEQFRAKYKKPNSTTTPMPISEPNEK